MNHTRTPWQVVDHQAFGPIILSGDGPDATDVLQFLNMEDAAFIVRAVNAYERDQEIIEELINALKDIQGRIYAIQSQTEDSRRMTFEFVWKRCMGAIAKAESK